MNKLTLTETNRFMTSSVDYPLDSHDWIVGDTIEEKMVTLLNATCKYNDYSITDGVLTATFGKVLKGQFGDSDVTVEKTFTVEAA